MTTAAHIQQRISDAFELLLCALRDRPVDSLLRYLKFISRFHRYSLGNQLLIFDQRPGATLVAGHSHWKSLDRTIKPGELAIAILAPLVRRSKRFGRAGPGLAGLRVAEVYDLAQTTGKEVPQLPEITGQPGLRLQQLEELIQLLGIELHYQMIPRGVNGTSHSGAILVRPDLTPAARFLTLVHELAHILLHSAAKRRHVRSIRETEAEAVAFAVSHAIGLSGLDRSVDYIRMYGGERCLLGPSGVRCQRVAAQILTFLESNGQR